MTPSHAPQPDAPGAGAPRPDGPDAAEPPRRRDWFGLAVLATGLGLIVLDGTIVGVAMPAIMADLHLELTDAQWVTSLYAVVLAALLPSTGKLADAVGRRRLFLLGLAVFAAGSGLAAAAGGAGSLIASRAVQALGAAMIMPSTLSTVNAVFRGRHRAAAFGVWGAVISGAAAVGPLAGGALVQWVSWHWIFLVNIPLCAVILLCAIATVRETRQPDSRPGVDVDGALLSLIGFGALVFACIEGPELGWWTPREPFSLLGVYWPADAPVSVIPVAGAVAAAGLGLFAAWERHRARNGRSALLDLRLFRLPTFTWGNVTAGAVAVGEFALVFVLPLFLVNALGLSAMGAGVVLAAMAIGAFASGAAARHVAARLGAPGTVVLGLCLELAGIAVLAVVVRAGAPGWVIAAPLVGYGLGLGLASAQLTGTVLRDVPAGASGQASATQSTVRQVGSALGTAVSGTVLSAALATTLPSALAGAGLAGPAADGVAEAVRTSAGGALPALRAAGDGGPFGPAGDVAVRALSEGFADATRWGIVAAGAFLAVGLAGAVRVAAASRTGGAAAER